MAELKERLPGWVTPQFLMSAGNFLAIAFTGGMIYSTAQGEIAASKQDIKDLKAEVRALRAQDTAIAVLRADMSTVKESVQRIEGRLERATITR